MSQFLKEYKGTWEEILTYSDELAGHHIALKIVETAPHTQETDLSLETAAAIMNVSLSYVAKRTESGELPSYGVGGERRVRRGDLVIYQEACKRKALAAFAEMAADAQEMGLY